MAAKRRKILAALLCMSVLLASVYCVCAAGPSSCERCARCKDHKRPQQDCPNCPHCSSVAAMQSRSAGSFVATPMGLQSLDHVCSAAQLQPRSADSTPVIFLPIQITSRTLLHQHCALII
jgi:hypothetical protein